MRDNDTPTGKIIAWALARPVLTKWLAVAAEDDPGDGLMCTVIDLLDPQRSPLAVAFLKATGAPLAGADAVYDDLEADCPPGQTAQWMTATDWDAVRAAILDAHADACAWLCDQPHPN